jgi:hypothetical protein
MPTKRFLITLGLLILSLFALVSGVSAALEHMNQSPAQNSVVFYDEQGNTLYAYNGNLNDCAVSLRPNTSIAGPHFLHRT